MCKKANRDENEQRGGKRKNPKKKKQVQTRYWGKKILQKYPSKHGVKKVKEIQQKHKNKKNIQKSDKYIFQKLKLIFNS